MSAIIDPETGRSFATAAELMAYVRALAAERAGRIQPPKVVVAPEPDQSGVPW